MNKNNAKVIRIAHILWCKLKISLQWLTRIHFKMGTYVQAIIILLMKVVGINFY